MDGGGGGTLSAIRIVGVMLVRNEDLHVEQALRNVVGFCDVLHVADNRSTDRTWEIVQDVAQEFAHVDVRRLRRIRKSQAMVERYAGSDTWVLGVDGDELYDPVGLGMLRDELLAGAYRDRFRIKSNVLNAVALDKAARTATGYLAPPARPMTKLFNFASVERWNGPSEQVLHGGDRVFRPGFDDRRSENIGDRLGWDESHFRCLHCCFVARSTLDPPDTSGTGRPSPIDLKHMRESTSGWRRALRLQGVSQGTGSAWKADKYRRGDLVTVDASPFLGNRGAT